MADDKKIPSWQRNATDGSTQAASQEHDASSSVIDQVRKFLQDPEVRDASLEKKRDFLLSKNISGDIIHQVMASESPGDSADTDGSKEAATQEFNASKRLPLTDGSSEAATQEFDASKKAPQGPAYVKTTDGSAEAANQEFEASKVASTHDPTEATLDKTKSDARSLLEGAEIRNAPIHKKRALLQSKGVSQEVIRQLLYTDGATFDAAEFNATASVNAPVQQIPRDIPPVVTYPEFLVQPQNPPPLVTVDRLVNTAYAAGALTATIYALSKYIISPMSDTLNDARHQFSEHTNHHVHDFNEKLTKLVSTIPSTVKSPAALGEALDSDAESVVSDPTELFHRDIGTQTSPALSRRPSNSSSETDSQKPEALVAKHAARLNIIHSHLSELLSDNEDNGITAQAIQDGVSEVRHYVDTLYYTPPVYQYQQGDNAWTPQGTPKSDKFEATAAFKAEIRGVKGVLLSAKRFPSAGRAGA